MPSSLSWVATRLATLVRAPLLDLRSWSVGGWDGALLLVVSTGAVVGVGSDVAEREREASPSRSAMMAVRPGAQWVFYIRRGVGRNGFEDLEFHASPLATVGSNTDKASLIAMPDATAQTCLDGRSLYQGKASKASTAMQSQAIGRVRRVRRIHSGCVAVAGASQRSAAQRRPGQAKDKIGRVVGFGGRGPRPIHPPPTAPHPLPASFLSPRRTARSWLPLQPQRPVVVLVCLLDFFPLFFSFFPSPLLFFLPLPAAVNRSGSCCLAYQGKEQFLTPCYLPW